MIIIIHRRKCWLILVVTSQEQQAYTQKCLEREGKSKCHYNMFQYRNNNNIMPINSEFRQRKNRSEIPVLQNSGVLEYKL